MSDRDLILFSPLRLGPYEIQNRLAMAPMTRNRAGTGRPSVGR